MKFMNVDRILKKLDRIILKQPDKEFIKSRDLEELEEANK